MNNPNPLLPQGALPPKAKSTLYFKILMIVAVHVVLLGGLLIVGCKDTTKTSTTPKTDGAAETPKDPMTPTTDIPSAPPSNMAATTVTAPGPSSMTAATPTVTPMTSSLPPLPGATPTVTPTAGPIATTTTPLTATPVAPAASGPTTYVIASGDLLSTIAKKNSVTLKALQEANPGVDAHKLQIGHKLNIPAPTAVASATPAAGGTAPIVDAAPVAAGDATTYTVKTGDSLTKIAKAHGTTYKALEALNDMKTSNIKAGQKLKVPVMKVASVDAPSTTTTAPTPGSVTPAPTVRAN